MSYMYKIGILLFMICSLLTVQGQEKLSLSLAECIALSIKNNPNLQRAELSLSRDAIRHKQAQYNRLPSVSANVSHGGNEGRSVNPTTNQFVTDSYFSGNQSVDMNIPIFNGLKILHDVRMKAQAQTAGKLEFDNAVNELKLDVIEAYITVLTSKDMLAQAEGALLVTEENVRRTDVLHREGAVNPGDYHDLKGQLQSEQNTLESTKQALQNSRLRLASLLNMPVAELVDVEPLAMPVEALVYDEADLFERAKVGLPQMAALKWRIKEAEQGVKVAKADYYPSLSLNAGLWSRFSSASAGSYWKQMDNFLSKGISLNLRVPIFSQFAVRSQVRMAKLNAEDARLAQTIAENALREETAKTVFSLHTLKNNVKNLRQQELSYQEAFRIAQVHFDTGNSNSVMLLVAKNKLDNTKNQLLIKQYEWLLQKYINDYYAGTLEFL